MVLPGSFYAPEDYPRTHTDCLTQPAPQPAHFHQGPVVTQAQDRTWGGRLRGGAMRESGGRGEG